MSSHSFLRALLLTTALGVGSVAAPAIAQFAPPSSPRQSIDANGVDLYAGTLDADGPAVAYGQSNGLSFARLWRNGNWTDTVVAYLYYDGGSLTVSFGGVSDHFTQSGSTFTSTEGNGSTLTLSGTTYTYTKNDGTVATFSRNLTLPPPFYANEGYVTSVVAPSGDNLTYTYDNSSYCSGTLSPSGCTQTTYVARLASVKDSFGYQFSFAYQRPLPGTTGQNLVGWATSISATGTNLADATNTSTRVESFTNTTIIDPLSRETQYRIVNGQLLGITYPGSTSEDKTITYNAGTGRVATVTTAKGTWTYGSPSDVSGVRTVVVTDPLSHNTTYTFDIALQRVKTQTDALSHTTHWDYDSTGRLTQTTQPEGNYTHLTYDARGNVTEQRTVSKTPGTPADIVTSAVFPTGCLNSPTCNEPTTTTDANGNTTRYTYNTATGQVLTVQPPAPAGVGTTPRPQTTYGYTSFQAYFSNGTNIVASGQPVSLLTSTSQCQTGSSCAGTADEVKTVISYGPQVAGTGNNLLPVSITSGAGGGTSPVTATTAYAYDSVGDLISVDGPISGTDDTTTYRYDADREQVGIIAADPDGSGSRKRAAQRITYDSRGRATLSEAGTVTGIDDPSWAAFSPAYALATTYDTADRKLTDTLKSGSTVYGVTQYIYDHQRPDCSVVRMNSATWGTPLASCTATLSAGPNGYDRVTRISSYDVVDRPLQVTTGYDTPDASAAGTVTFTANGQTGSLKDGNGNLTTYSYDGFDRLVKTAFPVPSGTGSSTTDYEQYDYYPDGSIKLRRLRDTTTINYTYDHLNRLTLEDFPGTDPNVTLGYDLINRLTSATTSAQTVTLGYDALSRMTSQSGPLGTVSAQYDAAGRRTRLTWPDAFYVTYDYDNVGNMLHVRENGAASGIGVLASFGYDDLGNRASLTRGNGTVTGYTPDAVSRLSSLTQNLSGTAADLTLGFTYNPASQIGGTTRSNTAYSASFADKGLAYTVNGLNQTTASSTDTIGYDGMGNVHTVNANTYSYNHENMLLTGPNGTSYGYDPLLRLYQESATGVFARLQYDGLDMVGEYDSTNALQKRYVFGPGSDEPLVEYDRSGSTFARAWLHADERGSIIARSNDSGAETAIDTYDEYGVPGSGNVGRFQYTGQAWLPELGAYYYKARLYSPQLGRFFQTDPIGYADGPNWYNYVGGDPINLIDPLGLECNNGKPGNTDAECEPNGGLRKPIVVTGQTPPDPPNLPSPPLSAINTPGNNSALQNSQFINNEIVVTAQHYYKSVDAAARAALDYYNPISISTNTEFIGLIYKVPFVGYTFGSPAKGTNDHVRAPVCLPGVCGAFYHTHAAYDPLYDNENFSPQDIGIARYYDVPMYLGTPSGTVKVYTPQP